MSDKTAGGQREEREAFLVSNRARELARSPIKGAFDLNHLRAIHAYCFQDLLHHRPGIIRGDTSHSWIKNRVLEGKTAAYSVLYAHENVESRITEILDDFGGSDALNGITPDIVATSMAKLYGDLDYVHGFYEGNSRTLREFTRNLADASGYRLDWIKTTVGAKERNELYVARDVAVLERAFPDLTLERAMKTDDRAEYESWFNVQALR